MKYGSVCSGIEAATVGWHPLGWKAAWFSEIEPFPCRLLKHHYPDVPNLGDMTKLLHNKKFNESIIDLLVGGTPCQSFSVAGLRSGLDSENGNLALEYCRLLIAKRPRWFVWENVPGVFSSFTNEAESPNIQGEGFENGADITETADFATLLTAFSECGYSCAWRVFDSQYFGVPQRRRRVFVVGYLGNDWRPPAAVLLDQESLRRDTTPSRKEGQEIAGTLNARTKGGGFPGSDESMSGYVQPLARPITTRVAKADLPEQDNLNVGEFWDGSQTCQTLDAVLHKGQMMPEKQRFPCVLQPKIFQPKASVSQGIQLNDQSPALGTTKTPAVLENKGYTIHGTDGTVSVASETEIHSALRGRTPGQFENSTTTVVSNAKSIRRLTPLECERLQGFPDNYTNIPKASDSARYKALGNSMTTNVMAYIGKRIDLVDKVINGEI